MKDFIKNGDKYGDLPKLLQKWANCKPRQTRFIAFAIEINFTMRLVSGSSPFSDFQATRHHLCNYEFISPATHNPHTSSRLVLGRCRNAPRALQKETFLITNRWSKRSNLNKSVPEARNGKEIWSRKEELGPRKNGNKNVANLTSGQNQMVMQKVEEQLTSLYVIIIGNQFVKRW